VAWEKTAEICSQYVKKGSQVYLEGKIQTRKWQDKEGGNRYTTEIVVNQLVLLGKGGGQRPEGAGPDYHSAGAPPKGGNDDFPGSQGDSGGFDPNDDVPF